MNPGWIPSVGDVVKITRLGFQARLWRVSQVRVNVDGSFNSLVIITYGGKFDMEVIRDPDYYVFLDKVTP